MLSPKDVKDILNISLSYTYNLLKTDGFPTIKIGKRYFIPKNALDKWVNTYTYKEYYMEEPTKQSGSKSGSKKRKMRKVVLN